MLFISIIDKGGNVEPMFVKKRVREEIRGDDGTILGYKYVMKDVLNLDDEIINLDNLNQVGRTT